MVRNRFTALALCGAVAVLFLAVTDTHTGYVTKHASIVLLGSQPETQMLDVVTQRTWFDR
jgi:hypothetical protein